MFTGSVCAHVREWFKSNASAFAGRRVFSGCWGNFTIETVLSQGAPMPAEIISNDVSLYSSALGVFYTDQAPLRLTPAQREFDWLADYLRTPLSAAAAIVVLLELAPFSAGKTAYHARMRRHIVTRFGDYHTSACERLRKRKELLSVKTYMACDVGVFEGRRRRDDVFLSFMPTYSGGYERLYRFLDAVIDWEGRPDYEIMTPDRKASLLGRICEAGSYVHVDDMRREPLHLVAIVEGGHSRPVYVYSDLKGLKTQVYRRAKQSHKAPNIAILGPHDESPKGEISFLILNAGEFSWFRDQYLSKGITPADPQWRFGLCLDGMLFGVLGWSRGYDGASYYLMCDVAVSSQRYERLSKLVCMVANTQEMGRLLRQQTGRLWHTFETTAFTRKPVSMKYRGVLRLVCRNEKDGKLSYAGDFTGTLRKATRKWQAMERKASSKPK